MLGSSLSHWWVGGWVHGAKQPPPPPVGVGHLWGPGFPKFCLRGFASTQPPRVAKQNPDPPPPRPDAKDSWKGHERREADRCHQLQTAMPSGVMPTPLAPLCNPIAKGKQSDTKALCQTPPNEAHFTNFFPFRLLAKFCGGWLRPSHPILCLGRAFFRGEAFLFFFFVKTLISDRRRLLFNCRRVPSNRPWVPFQCGPICVPE